MEVDVDEIPQRALTGELPSSDAVDAQLQAAFDHATRHTEGVVADYIPILSRADPDAFGLCLVDVDGGVHEVGDSRVQFSIQSISKAFVYALLCEQIGHRRVFDVVGVNNTGLAFNSLIAIELNAGHPMNPMVNAGAIATTALIPADSPEDRWDIILRGLSRFAGRDLQLDEEVYESEAATNQRNQAIGKLLEAYGRVMEDPVAAVDVYTRQCAIRVDARDLAVMGATLADGGVNPVTGDRVVSADVCRDTLAVLAANGLYERSGEWLFELGLPGKSGVSGGLVTVAPGKVGVGAYAPPLDSAGNSIRSQIATAYLSRALGLNLFASAVRTTPRRTARSEEQ